MESLLLTPESSNQHLTDLLCSARPEKEGPGYPGSTGLLSKGSLML